MAVGRGQDRRLQVGPQVFPIVVGSIPGGFNFGRGFEVGAKSRGFDRCQEAERAALILAKLTLRDGPQQSRHGRMKRPAGVETTCKAVTYCRTARTDGVGDCNGSGHHPFRSDLCVNSSSNEFNNFVARGDERDIRISPLNFGPVVAGINTKSCSVLAE